MRRKMMTHQIDILVVKDFSRFSRRNSRGLVELEYLRQMDLQLPDGTRNFHTPNVGETVEGRDQLRKQNQSKTGMEYRICSGNHRQ